jgi:hypothetical protein
VINVRCRTCRQVREVDCTNEEYQAWQSGMLIQTAMPNTSKEQRELLISGTCGECFAAMFAGDDDE